jgi:hypothetical protein
MPDPSFAFTGTVRAVDAGRAVVEVDEAVHAPDPVDLGPGDSVTVQLAEGAPAPAVGDRATFYADPLIYGDTLTVAEVSRGEPAAAAPHAEARAERAQDAIREHAQAADAVVRGHVVALAAVPREDRLREHHPHWWIATLDVDLVERGDVAEGRVDVLYANSLDVRWRRWPKPKAGQGGMWILHRTAPEQAALAPFTLMHPEDLQPSLQLELLR